MDDTTVRQALLYVKTMQRLDAAGSASQAVRINIRLLQQLLGIDHAALMNSDAVQLLTAIKTVHFAMQQAILPKFALLAPDDEPREKSIFDDYDAMDDEENGNEAEPTSQWKIHEQNIEAVARLAIRVFRDSYSGVQQAAIVPLLEHIAYELQQKD